MLQEPLSQLLGIAEGGGVLLANFSNDRKATTAVQAVTSLQNTSFSKRKDHILSRLEEIATDIEQNGLPRTVLFQQLSSNPQELHPALAGAIADSLHIEGTARALFLARIQKALTAKKRA